MKPKIKHNPAYHRAFFDFIRYGTPIIEPYYIWEKKSINDHYIWRTQRDNSVRPSHRIREGIVFEWENSPIIPGMEPNCRCWAESINAIMDPLIEPYIDLCNTDTWPLPPIDGILKESIASKNKPRSRGEKSLYDEYGGEWRVGRADKYHHTHWDYKSVMKFSEWLNIPINNKPTKKKRNN